MAHKQHSGKPHKRGHSDHQGPIHLGDMTSIVQGHGTQDPLAHSAHHEMNGEHYTGVGLSPHGHYADGDEPCNDGHGGMGENYSFH